jgi:TDG/mug DNA glycosylase family protein
MIKYYIAHKLKILFVGINPHPGSDRRRVPFSNNKMFWYLLRSAGLLPDSRDQLKNDTYLYEFYMNRFLVQHQCAVINIIDRPTVNISFLKRNEELLGRKRLSDVILYYSPRVVCFVGKITYQKFMGERQCTYGWKGLFGSSALYVMHTPLRGYADVRVKELKEILAKVSN